MILSMFLSGCNANLNSIQNNAGATDSESKGTLNIVDGRTKNYDNNSTEQSKEIKDFSRKNMTAEKRAEMLREVIEKMKEVNKAYVIINGNTAIVGIDLQQEMNDTNLIELKRIIESEVIAEDNGIKHAVVTASPDLVERIIKMVGADESKLPGEDRKLQPFKDNDAFFRVAPTI